MRLSRYLILMTLLFISVSTIIVATTVGHEYLHQLIFKKYGINSTVKYYFIESFIYEIKHPFDFDISNSQALAITYPDQNSNKTCGDTCTMLHTQVEIMDHGMSSLLAICIFFFLLYVAYWEIAHEDTSNWKEGKNKSLTEEYERITGRKWVPLRSAPSVAV